MWNLRVYIDGLWLYDAYWTGARCATGKINAKKYHTETGAQAVADVVNGENGGLKINFDGQEYPAELRVRKDEQ